MAEAIPQVWERDPEQARQGLDEVRLLTRGALAEMRTLLMELRPQSVTEKALGDLLDQLTQAISNRTRIPIELEIENDTILPADVQVIFYRIAQESFNNIAKHANAANVRVKLNAWPDQATLVITDDGQGFDLSEDVPGHLGLGIMRDRARQIGAELSVISQPNQGTEISIHWQKGENNL
jgi:two-component system nitrate/nitrite sensor histidine kinase NarX